MVFILCVFLFSLGCVIVHAFLMLVQALLAFVDYLVFLSASHEHL